MTVLANSTVLSDRSPELSTARFQSMNLLRSSSLASESSRWRTRASSMTTRLSARSEALKLTSSSTRSRIVCNRRAPMFWVDRFTWKARSAMVSIAESANSSVDALSGKQGLVLAQERGARLAENPREVITGEVVHLDANRKSPLELGHQVCGLRPVEGAGSDEQNVVGPDGTVLGVDGGAFDDRQQVALHSLARDVGPAARALIACDLVDLVDEDDARLLGEVTAVWLIFSGSISASISCCSKIGRAWPTVMRRVCDCLGMIFSNMFWRSISICSKLPAPRIDTGAIERPGNVISTSRSSSSPSCSRAFILSRDRWRRRCCLGGLGRVDVLPRRRGGWRQEQVEQLLFDAVLGLVDDFLALGVAHQTDRGLDEVADQAFDVAADIADLGVLGGLGFHERRAHEHRQPPGDLGLAHARRADQHDVLGRDLLAQVVGKLAAPPPVAQRDGDSSLGIGLAHDVAIELSHNLPRRQLTFAVSGRAGTAVPPPSEFRLYKCRCPRRSPATRGRSRRQRDAEYLTSARAAARA